MSDTINVTIPDVGEIEISIVTGPTIEINASNIPGPQGAPGGTLTVDEMNAIANNAVTRSHNRMMSVDSLAQGNAIEILGVPEYVSDVSQYSAYGITDTGWYTFVHIFAPSDVKTDETTAITGAAGYIIEQNKNYVDVAIRFEVAATSKRITVLWNSEAGSEDFVFKATDLAVRNLDYRTTFYVYDLAPFVSWAFAPTKDATVADGKKYYTKSGNMYTLAELTTGAACVCYYELVDEAYVLTEDATFVDGKTYYTTTDGTTYTEATVTAGEAVPTAYYNHSKLTIQGMTRNITYRLDETIDCPSEVILPAIEDETHGCWFEFQLRHSGKYSMTLTVPEGVKVATEHTQAEDTGFNLIDLHYMCIDNIKMWRFMNTHSSIPTS